MLHRLGRHGVCLLAGLILTIGCATTPAVEPRAEPRVETVLEPVVLPEYARPVYLATLDEPEMTESSGLAVSLRNPNVIWTVNDSGHAAVLYAFHRRGRRLARVTLDGAVNLDWESLASFTDEKTAMLLVADTGDNRGQREQVTLYLLPEPDVELGPTRATVTRTMRLRYADGPRDVEAVAVDPVTRCVLLLEKRALPPSGLYAAPLDAGDDLTVQRIADLPVSMATAMDITRDGSRLFVGTYGPTLVFERHGNDPRWNARSPALLPMPPRKQGETLAVEADGYSLLATSEKSPTPLWSIHPVPAPAPPPPPRSPGPRAR